MCFSAEASFAAGTLLTVSGIAAQRHTRTNADRFLAAIPSLFGVHQFIEGIIWLTLENEGWQTASYVSTHAFSVIICLWPSIYPITQTYRERGRFRRSLLRILAAAGVATTVYMLYVLFSRDIVATVDHNSIRYDINAPGEVLIRNVYVAVLTGACVVSQFNLLRILGALLLSTYLYSFYVYQSTYPSVWCFYGALSSVFIYLHLRRSTNAQGNSPLESAESQNPD